MIIFPAIDLKEGKCVRLYQGKMSSAEVVAEDPLSNAKRLKDGGAEYIHIVDLDGAVKGSPQNLDIIKEIVNKVDIPVQLGGGIRDIETIDKIIDAGVSKVILGTAALNKPDLLIDALNIYREKIAVGIDAKAGLVAVDGWINVSDINYIDFGKKMESIGVKTIIYTDIGRDGTLKGANLKELSDLKSSVSCRIIASGGVSSVKDITALKNIGMYGAIIGKALYNGDIFLSDAIEAGR
ncbi:MAG: 1-(5-phosphoribosyl)-5-[(5-phosphoribosylamino)methylideneamino]imidazole-4-carboxamide isomerase [Candidatus Afipia apatlaquensis]|uniref:1-(5-phosphoribosyl)-5-[(5-phosphoribosylamino)methylideneamino] imidazole-4-carboxamide isomerase n=1 Tax=Candidatus Afipia apatlaquensis TaxID=2712852 RepID=A0A7C9RI88_9BRAD|nr:1-(5-phosphoribosyl)-5-[(5-phosphoribosylamino)methylideneamino]imidazole-4-carboxamide isomerase [Candidatus Afipia apatlaquensis]